GRFDHRVHHAAHGAVLVADWAVAEGKISPFGIAVTVDDEGKILDEGGLARKRAFGDWSDLMPGFAPDVPERAAERRWLVAENGPETVIVEGDELRPPDDGLGELGVERHAERGLERGRPLLEGPQRSRCPVMRTDGIRHLAAAIEKVGCPAHKLF